MACVALCRHAPVQLKWMSEHCSVQEALKVRCCGVLADTQRQCLLCIEEGRVGHEGCNRDTGK
jgi:hypothetical protein